MIVPLPKSQTRHPARARAPLNLPHGRKQISLLSWNQRNTKWNRKVLEQLGGICFRILLQQSENFREFCKVYSEFAFRNMIVPLPKSQTRHPARARAPFARADVWDKVRKIKNVSRPPSVRWQLITFSVPAARWRQQTDQLGRSAHLFPLFWPSYFNFLPSLHAEHWRCT